MKLEEIVSKMSILYLGRLVDSFLRDVPKDDEEKMRSLILKNKDEFVDYSRIKNKLDFIGPDKTFHSIKFFNQTRVKESSSFFRRSENKWSKR